MADLFDPAGGMGFAHTVRRGLPSATAVLVPVLPEPAVDYLVDSDPDVSFVVLGRPQQQGSKTRGVTADGRDYSREAGAEKLRPWRRDALSAARESAHGLALPGGVFVRVRFYYSRPASHFGTGRNAGVLKPNVPIYKESKPDTDKLQRAIGDVLTQSGIIRDDTKIVHWDAAKLWSDHDRAEVSIWSL